MGMLVAGRRNLSDC